MSDIGITRIDIHKTYEGWLAGWPSPAECVEIARAKAEYLFPHVRPIVVVEPEIIENEGTRMQGTPMIPRWCHMAILTGPAVAEDDDGTHLVAVWFAREHSLDLENVVPRLDWAKNATGWGY